MGDEAYRPWMTLAMQQVLLVSSFIVSPQAQKALASLEVPIGAIYIRHPYVEDQVVLTEGEVLATGFNLTNARRNATAHAEFLATCDLIARDDAAELLADPGLILYVTCEPCIM